MKGHQRWSGTQHTVFCREISFVVSSACDEGGGSQKVTNDDEGEGGGSRYPPKLMTSFMNSPLAAHCRVLALFDSTLPTAFQWTNFVSNCTSQKAQIFASLGLYVQFYNFTLVHQRHCQLQCHAHNLCSALCFFIAHIVKCNQHSSAHKFAVNIACSMKAIGLLLALAGCSAVLSHQ